MPSCASALAKALAKPPFSASMPSSKSPRARHALDLLHRDRRLSGQPPRPRQGGVEQFVIGDHPVDQAQFERLLGLDRIADQVHLQSLVLPHQPRQALGAAEAGDDPELDLGLAEDRRTRGDAHVTGHRKLTAAAEGQAVDGGDSRHAVAFELAQQSMRGVDAARSPPCSSIDVNALMSAPALNRNGLEEAITSARTGGSSFLTCFQTLPKSSITLGAIEFI